MWELWGVLKYVERCVRTFSELRKFCSEIMHIHHDFGFVAEPTTTGKFVLSASGILRGKCVRCQDNLHKGCQAMLWQLNSAFSSNLGQNLTSRRAVILFYFE